MSEPGSYLCCGVRVDGFGPDSAVQELLKSRYGLARGVHLCNSYTLALALRDVAYREVLNSGHLNFADGHYVAMVGRWRGQLDLTERVYGPNLMLAAMDQGRQTGLRHYLYGATQSTVERLAASLRLRYPGVEIVGVEAPPFRALDVDEERELAARLAQARPDIMWIGTGTPRQDRFVAGYSGRLGTTLVPVGAAFDFHSGAKRGAPKFVQRIGMEWLFRFAMEPRRLWRRYLIGIPVFVFGVLTDVGRHRLRRPNPRIQTLTAPLGAAQVPVPRPTLEANGHPLAANGHTVEVNGHTLEVNGHSVDVNCHTVDMNGHTLAEKNGHRIEFQPRPAEPLDAVVPDAT